MLGDHHIGAKSLFLEGACHVPFIVRPPRPPWQRREGDGQRVEHLATLADIMPTVLAAAGVETPESVVGQDLMSLDNDRLFYGHCGSYFGVLDGATKYVRTACGDDELLFDLANDPCEQRDLHACPDAAPTLTRMREALLREMAASPAAAPYLEDGAFKPAPGISGPDDVVRWPGLHSITDHSVDVLH
jgi:arylsulfatase A-like enzyme